MTNHPLKGRGFAHVTHFCLHNCGLGKNFATVRVNKIDDGPPGCLSHFPRLTLVLRYTKA